MAGYTKLIAGALDMARSIGPRDIGKGVTLTLLAHDAAAGYAAIVATKKGFRVQEEQDNVTANVKLEVAELGAVTEQHLLDAVAFALDAKIYKIASNEKGIARKPPLGQARRVWLFELTAVGESFEP